jgi:hypothetical protein
LGTSRNHAVSISTRSANYYWYVSPIIRSRGRIETAAL